MYNNFSEFKRSLLATAVQLDDTPGATRPRSQAKSVRALVEDTIQDAIFSRMIEESTDSYSAHFLLRFLTRLVANISSADLLWKRTVLDAICTLITAKLHERVSIPRTPTATSLSPPSSPTRRPLLSAGQGGRRENRHSLGEGKENVVQEGERLPDWRSIKWEDLYEELNRLAQISTVPPLSPALSFVPPLPTRLEEKLFLDPAAPFKLKFSDHAVDLPFVDPSLLELFPAEHFVINDRKPRREIMKYISLRCDLLLWIEAELNGFYGQYQRNPKIQSDDSVKILQILCNLRHNPCLQMLEVIKAIWARHNIYPLDLRPVFEQYFDIKVLNKRKIHLFFGIEIHDVFVEQETHSNCGLIIKMGAIINFDPESKEIHHFVCEFDYPQRERVRQPHLEAMIDLVKKFELSTMDILFGINAKLTCSNYQASDTLQCISMRQLPVETLLPYYTDALYKFGLSNCGHDPAFVAKVDGIVENDLNRSLGIEGLNLYDKRKRVVEDWAAAQSFLKSQGFIDEVINAIKLQTGQGMMNPGYALWTEVFIAKLQTFFKISPSQFVGADGKPIRVEKNIFGQWVLKQEFIIYGFVDFSSDTNMYEASSPLFNFYMYINIDRVGIDRKWIRTAMFGITPLGQRILKRISRETVFDELLANYSSYRAITDIEVDQEVLVKFNAYPLPDSRKFLVRSISPVPDDSSFAALRAILSDDYARKKCPSELLIKLLQTLEKDQIVKTLISNDYKQNVRLGAKPVSSSLEVSDQQLAQHVQYYFNTRASVVSIVHSFNFYAAFALMQGFRLHYFKECSRDPQHPTPWMKHQFSYTEVSSVELTDVCILESLNNKSYWRLGGDFVRSG